MTKAVAIRVRLSRDMPFLPVPPSLKKRPPLGLIWCECKR